MQKQFTASFMQANRGCYQRHEMEERVLKGRAEISATDFLACNIPIKDKYWFFCRKVFTKEQNQQIALQLAELVLPIYEKKYPKNKSPRKCIDAIKKYLAGEIKIDELRKFRSAAAYAAASIKKQIVELLTIFIDNN